MILRVVFVLQWDPNAQPTRCTGQPAAPAAGEREHR